jgi:hypothetical protein
MVRPSFLEHALQQYGLRKRYGAVRKAATTVAAPLRATSYQRCQKWPRWTIVWAAIMATANTTAGYLQVTATPKASPATHESRSNSPHTSFWLPRGWSHGTYTAFILSL